MFANVFEILPFVCSKTVKLNGPFDWKIFACLTQVENFCIFQKTNNDKVKNIMISIFSEIMSHDVDLYYGVMLPHNVHLLSIELQSRDFA